MRVHTFEHQVTWDANNVCLSFRDQQGTQPYTMPPEEMVEVRDSLSFALEQQAKGFYHPEVSDDQALFDS